MKTKRNLFDKLFGLNKELDFPKEKDTQKESDPYIFEVQNTTDEEKKAVLFGWNKYWNKPNFGSDEGVIIRNILGAEHGIDYSYLLAQSANQSFKIGKWRFQSANSMQLFCELAFIHTDANGKMHKIPLNLAVMRDMYQFQSDILDVTKPLTVTGGTDIEFIIKPQTSILFTVYPVSILSDKAELNKSDHSNRLHIPRLSGKNVGNVMVMSTQEMRWSEKLNKIKEFIFALFKKKKYSNEISELNQQIANMKRTINLNITQVREDAQATKEHEELLKKNMERSAIPEVEVNTEFNPLKPE